MGAVWPIVLLGVAGILIGGAYSLFRQGAGKAQVLLVCALGVLAGVGGVLWLLPES